MKIEQKIKAKRNESNTEQRGLNFNMEDNMERVPCINAYSDAFPASGNNTPLFVKNQWKG